MEEFQSSLQSLKQLYGLLQIDLSNSVSVLLDDKSRLLLMDLLDSAVENVLNDYSKKGRSSVEFTGPEIVQCPSISEESDSTYHDCMSSSSESADDSLNKRATVRHTRQMTKESAQQNACRSHLSKQASAAIKKIDKLSGRRSSIVLQQPSKQQRQKYHARDSDQMNRKVRKLQPLPHNPRRRFQRQHGSDASLSSTSSKWSSQNTSIPYEASLSDDGSEDFSVSCSDDENEVYSWASDEEPYESTSGKYYSGDDETEEDSKPRPQHRRQPRDSTKRRRPRKVDTSSKWKKVGQKFGRWNLLKSIIFPNHHHHLHSNADEFSSLENRKKACGKKKVPSKHIAKRSAFLKPDAMKRRVVEKIGNAMDNKLVQKPVNALWGLIKHARHAKKSKLPLRGSHVKIKTHSKMKKKWLKMVQGHKKKSKSKQSGPGFKKRK